MQSSQLWFKKLAKSRFLNGRWQTDENAPHETNPFDSIRDDLLEMLDIYNQHAQITIKPLKPSVPSRTILTLLCGCTQMRLANNDGYLDISLIITRDFQTAELPITRLQPKRDHFGATTWCRGTLEISSDQVIKNAFVQLIEASES